MYLKYLLIHLDVASAIGPIVSIKKLELDQVKSYMKMITISDSMNTYDIGKYYVILPQKTTFKKDDFIKFFNAKIVDPNFSYNSGDNTEWETIESIRKLVKIHIDPNFE